MQHVTHATHNSYVADSYTMADAVFWVGQFNGVIEIYCRLATVVIDPI